MQLITSLKCFTGKALDWRVFVGAHIDYWWLMMRDFCFECVLFVADLTIVFCPCFYVNFVN